MLLDYNSDPGKGLFRRVIHYGLRNILFISKKLFMRIQWLKRSRLLYCLLALSFFSCEKETPDEDDGYEIPPDYEYQGTINVRSASITLCYRDSETVDGDVVNVVVNGQEIEPYLPLGATNVCANLSGLSQGKNWIGITCLDKGTHGEGASIRIEINDGYSTQSFQLRAALNASSAYRINFIL